MRLPIYLNSVIFHKDEFWRNYFSQYGAGCSENPTDTEIKINKIQILSFKYNCIQVANKN